MSQSVILTCVLRILILRYSGSTRWDVVRRLLPPTVVGVAIGSQLLGEISANTAKLLIGFALAFILFVNLASHMGGSEAPVSDKVSEHEPPPAYATSIKFAAIVGLIGGFATILTNSMGPLLNVYLLAHRFEPKVITSSVRALSLSPTIGCMCTAVTWCHELIQRTASYAGPDIDCEDSFSLLFNISNIASRDRYTMR